MHISAKMALVPVVSWLLVVAGFVSPAVAQGTLKQKFGDWQHRCDRPNPAGPEQCILIQNVLDQSDLNLAVVILRVEDSAATAEARRRDPAAPAIRRPVLRVIAPLGILLPRGLGLKIDERDIGSTGFVRCLESGCVAEVDMDNALIDGFKKGKVALFAVFLTPEEGRGLPVTLSGFEQGFAQLQ
ncbi:MAG: invasion associated locus B family protein [Beijerinckiaceae bacterium]|nr:invasion associated locus B family protein [Beijerinckiaceae bacterium]